MDTPNIQNQKQSRAGARGFTLIELVLAMVLGSMILAGSIGVFSAMRSMETSFAARFERTNELQITQIIMTRSMLGLQMQETERSTVTRSNTSTDSVAEQEAEEPESRARIILETDTSIYPDSTQWTPQRFELVTATPPVPIGLASQAAGWYVEQDRVDSLDFSASDGSQGAVRGVYELRPAGQREAIMLKLGLIAPGEFDTPTNENELYAFTNASYQIALNPTESGLQSSPNWTLWWRPILYYEGRQLLEGQGPSPDTLGTSEEIRARLAGAVPLMHGIERCNWEIYKGDEYVQLFSALEMKDLPAYAQFEVILTNGQYASWMFEVDWVLGDDPSTTASGGSGDGEDEDELDGANDTGENRATRPGQTIDPDRARVFDFRNDR